MTNHEMKRKISAMLVMAMLAGTAAPAALAESTPGESDPAPEPLVQLIVPVQPAAPVQQQDASVPVAPVQPAAPAAPAAQTAEDSSPSAGAKTGPVYSAIKASVSAGTDSVTVIITEASSEAMYVAVGEQIRSGAHKGDSLTFSGLTPGVYDVEVDYENGTNVFRTSVTIASNEDDGDGDGSSEGGDSGDGGSKETVPPAGGSSGGSGDPIPPSGSGDNKSDPSADFAEFAMTAQAKNGLIVVSITGGSAKKEIRIEAQNGSTLEFNAVFCGDDGTGSGVIGKIDEETEEFGALDPGTYTVRAFYSSKESYVKTSTVTISASGTDSGSEGGSGSGSESGSGSGSESGTGSGTESGTGSGTESGTGSGSESGTGSGSESGTGSGSESGTGSGTEGGSGSGTEGGSGSGTEGGSESGSESGAGSGTENGTGSGTESGTEETGEAKLLVLATTDASRGMANGTISGTVQFTGDLDLVIKLYAAGSSEKIAEKILPIGETGSFSFTGLAAGDYTLKAFFYGKGSEPPVLTQNATIKEPEALKAIRITGVIPGENSLTVSGTAEAGKQILLTTTPAAAASSYAVAKDDGSFEAVVSCAAGTYTAVTAVYAADGSVSATATGSWTVTAPNAKPTLTVDPVTTDSTTVVAKTTAGTVVTLTTRDYTQTAAADESGLIHFTLPHTYLKGDTFTFTVHYGKDQSFTQKLTVAKKSTYETLEKGDKGSSVLALTTRLAELGYPVKATKTYGDTVVAAIRLFQKANGLTVDGIAGNKTQAVLYSVSAIAYGQGEKYPTYVRGDRGEALIYALQQRLKDLGYYTLKVDGIFGSGTQRAVRDFQSNNGLTVTGKADNTTQVLLYSSAAKAAGCRYDDDYDTLVRSNRYQSAVVPLQRRLKALGYYAGSIDGYFGSQTYRAVRNFQSRNGITVTGKADPYTQQVLYSSSAKAASGSSSSGSGTSTGYRLLYWGCTGSSVKRLQNALINAGYKSYVRVADGIYGQWTYDGVRAYQKDHGLVVDGIAGRNTQNSLYGTSY